MTRRLWVALSVALMAASANAAVPSNEIERIEILIDQGNWVELRSYLSDNPWLMLGDDALAQELRRFMADTENLFTALVFEPSLFPRIPETVQDPTAGQSFDLAGSTGAGTAASGSSGNSASGVPVSRGASNSGNPTRGNSEDRGRSSDRDDSRASDRSAGQVPAQASRAAPSIY